jgi:2-keto-4-pentenoate hydratase/2-oxohepta-3-ene-1,7-dioic acid hydratase in catechol pathway
MIRLVTFRRVSEKSAAIGLWLKTNGAVLPLQPSFKHLRQNESMANDMQSFIEVGSDGLAAAAIALNSKELSQYLIPFDQIALEAPIPVPKRNLLCVGKNYKDHVAEVAAADKSRGIGPAAGLSAAPDSLPKYPQFFTKAPSAVIPHLAKIESHQNITQWLDYEAELAVIIGKKGRDISADEAMDYVYGYTIANDVTSRDLQRHHGQWFKGKTLDATCPMGPCIIPKTSIPNPFNLRIQLWLNKIQRQDGNTSNMIFPIPEIIRHLSAGFTLQPGDIILTGTPHGVGYAMKPPLLLKPGDHVAIEIDQIGRLENTVE